MIKNSTYRSGFVYAAKHPENKELIKIGFTRKSPISRLKELGKTSNINDFILVDGRWVFDAIYSEKKVHDFLLSKNIVKEKEFFIVDEKDIKNLFDWMETVDIEKQNKLIISVKNKIIEKNEFDESEYISWSEDDFNHKFNYVKEKGLKNMEKMAAKGWGIACFHLAEYYMEKGSINENKWMVANCLYNAGEKLGEGGGKLRGMFWKSFFKDDILDEYFTHLWEWRDKITKNHKVPEIVEKTMQDETTLQKTTPKRAAEWSCWLESNDFVKKPKVKI